MSGTSEIAINITCDARDLTAGMTESRDQLNQTVTTIQRQETSWGSLAAVTLESLARIAGPVISLVSAQKQLAAATAGVAATNALATAPTLTFGAAVNFLLAPVTLIAGAIVLLGAGIYYFSQAEEEAATTTSNLGLAVDDIASKMSFMEQVQESFLAGGIGATGLEEISKLRVALDGLMSSLGELGNAIQQPFIDAGFEAGALAAAFSGFHARIQLVTGGIKLLTQSVEAMSTQVKSGIAALSLIGFQLTTGADAATAQAYLDNASAIRQMETEAYQFKKASDFAFGEIGALMANATAEAERRAEISRISSITSIQSLESETAALERHIAALKIRGEYDEKAKRQAEETANAIASQIEGIESGKVKQPDSPIENMIRQAEQAARQMALGADQAAISAAAAAGATDQQIQRIEAAIDVTNELKKAEEDRREAERAAAEAAKKAQEEENRIAKEKINIAVQFANTTAKLADEIAVLNGEMTKQEAREAELLRSGLSAQQAKEQAALEAEKEGLSTKKSDGKVGALQQGSAEAVGAVLAAINGDNDIPKQQLKVQEDMVQKLEDVNRSIEAMGDNGLTLIEGSLNA